MSDAGPLHGALSARPKMVPTPRMILWLAVGAPLWLLGLAVPGGWLAAAAFLAGVVMLALLQYLRLPAPHSISVARQLPSRFNLEAVSEIVWSIDNRGPRTLEVRLIDTFPEALQPLEPVPPGLLPAARGARVQIPVRAVRRGDFAFSDLYLRCRLPGGLIAKELRFGLGERVKVYPRVLAADEYQLLARIDERFDPIRRPRLIRGAGMEWESLREYLPGEDLRNVDWKASARRGCLISRNLRVERGQQVAILLDSGRLMANRIGRYPRLEHAVNAAVMLSFVCSKRGDFVSLAAFSNRIESFLPATRGSAVMPRVLETVYKVQSREVESDYWEVVAQIISKFRKRTLVVMLTEVLDSWGSSGLARNLIRAARRHLVLCVVMTDPAVARLADSIPEDAESAYLKAAACQLRLDRELALETMRSRGILVLETQPRKLSVQLVRRYLEIRQEGLQ